jgi:plasmid maintenance system antidote protein VapI
MAMFNPAHPGELVRETIEALREETGTSLTIEEVASGLGTTRKTLSSIINTTAEFWLHVQDNFDLAKARKKVRTGKIKVFWKPAAAI